jgi:predicted O-methyltransferase YrrM
LRAIEKEAHHGKRFLPIIGPKKGKFLHLVARAISARRVLDLGTLVGYSALLLSQAVGKNGKVITIELDKGMIEEARKNFREARSKNILLIEGDAKKLIKRVKQQFDLILLDTWKEDYIKLLPYCIKSLRKGGVLVADNALWDTANMQKFREALQRNKALDSVLIPIQDGMSLSVKK